MTVLVEYREGSLVITINRPEAGNSLNLAVAEGIAGALTDAVTNPDVSTVIVTGAGEKIFCAGMDLKAFAAGENMMPVADALRLLNEFPKPVIAAVNGAAVAGGFEVMMRADLVVAADHAKFGIPEVKRGLVASGGASRLPSRIPMAIALEMGLTGETFGAQRALELGLVNRVVPGPDVMDAALALAALINANGPLAVRMTKRLMREEIGPDRPEYLMELTAPVSASEDAHEGAIAFAEKRAPIWKGR